MERRILNVLKDLGLDCDVLKTSEGPTYTLFEISLNNGSRMSKVKKLSDDITINLGLYGVKVIAPMPGKETLGIEIPNETPKIVELTSLLHYDDYVNSQSVLPIPIGMDVYGKYLVEDLTKLPHLLVGGATGQGKSVFLNSVIVSLLQSKSADELQLVLIDPKRVEFSVYNPLKNAYLQHFDGIEEAVITNLDDAKTALDALCGEMDRRYSLLRDTSCRNILEYNKSVDEKMPYIVVVIDEYADLAITEGKAVEQSIVRLAQKARAVGIHLILATQRPSTSVITGAIKANFPARVAFRTMQRADSKTILDSDGAERLIGRGDMLFSLNGDITRLQGTYIDNDEISQIVKNKIEHGDILPNKFSIIPLEEVKNVEEPEPLDTLFGEAVCLIVKEQRASTFMLQRKFGIGYNRAGKIMDQLEAAGFVGPAIGGKPRVVFLQVNPPSNTQTDNN